MIPGVSPSVQSPANNPEGQRNALIAALEREQLDRQKRDQELERLRPLLVWAGHPCAFCGKSLRGEVEPEVARSLLKDLVHKECLEERESGEYFPLKFSYLERCLIPAE